MGKRVATGAPTDPWHGLELLLAAGCAALAVLAATGCDAAPGDGPADSHAVSGDVLLVTVDTLRPDHLGLYGYPRPTSPSLDRFFAEGALYRRAYATEANTPPSVVSLLTGRLPQEHGVRLFYQHVPRDVDLVTAHLPERFQTAAFVSNVVLTDEALGIAGRFDHYDDYVAQRESSREGIFERDARATTDAALAWLARAADPVRPLFLWVHYIDPHGPYRPPEDAAVRFESEGEHPLSASEIPDYLRDPGVLDGLHYRDRYDEEIAWMDAHVGRLLGGFAARRDLERALVIFTADHGESMMEHERFFTHGYHVFDEIVRVPLLLRGPGVEPGRHETLASGVDVAPTILHFVGVPVPAGWPDTDLRRPASIADDRIVFSEASGKRRQLRSAVQGRTKWLAAVVADPVRREPLGTYDLASDPDERELRPWRPGPAAARLAERIDADPDPAGVPERHVAGRRLEAPKVPPDLPEDRRRALEALGYLE